MKISKTLAAVAGVGLVAAGLLSASPASADPSGVDNFQARPLQGVGSDTTQNVLSDLANAVLIGGNKQIASWDAIGSPATFQTRASAACTYTRTEANGSGAGRSRLLESLQAADPRSGCLDFARSSSAKGTFTSTPSLTWIPFAKDASTYITRGDGNVARVGLTLTDVQNVYKCLFLPDIVPVLPQTGSGSRAFWLGQMGITEANISAGTYPCLVPVGTTVNGVPGTGRPYQQENDGRSLKTDEIMPFSIGLYNVQAAGNNTDVRGALNVLAQIGGTLPVNGNATFPVSRDLFNIIPTSKIAVAPFSTVFVGAGSLVCQQTSVIAANGFGPNPSCGDTSSQS